MFFHITHNCNRGDACRFSHAPISEAGIFASTFDLTGTRLITCEADKSIKVSEGMKNEEQIWREDEEATPESHPIDMEKWKLEWRAHRRFFSFVSFQTHQKNKSSPSMDGMLSDSGVSSTG